jgi:hypothetical protein
MTLRNRLSKLEKEVKIDNGQLSEVVIYDPNEGIPPLLDTQVQIVVYIPDNFRDPIIETGKDN